MSPRDAENARFEELMAREFPDGLVPTERARPRLDVPVDPEPPARQHEAETPADTDTDTDTDQPNAPEGFRSWTPPEPPDEPFVPPPLPAARRWTSAGITGTVLVVLPVVLVLIAAVGVQLPMLVSALAGIGFVVGVVLLLIRLRNRPPTDGDGAVV